MAGALQGLRIVELAGMGPAPFAGMMLADHGAEVIRIERPATSPGQQRAASGDVLRRSRKVVSIDLKTEAGRGVVRDLAADAHGLIEGFRPGATERLGLGPDDLLRRNPALVYGRMTGWGQDGPNAALAGHDINYIALAGTLHMLGRAGEKPMPAVNLVGDFGGGGMLLAFGMLAGLLHAQRTGEGQVVDCAMVDGAALIASLMWSLRGQGRWRDERGVNLLDTGAHFYDTYETADGKHVALGAIEPQFYAILRDKAGLADDPDFDAQTDPAAWPTLKAKLTALFSQRTRDDWCALLEHTDACFTPVLSMAEAPDHPHNVARGTFVAPGGIVQPAPAPRLSRTPAVPPAMTRSSDGPALLTALGFDPERIAALSAAGVIG
ncbi:CaiB/BaiF CoA transferase family protein [uncultured Sphingomonas sp.]|uniref:CaiB/BaiF CoA transferase family protein n=1 Tax=uncultured Sphingomonas sp. TaxID=158754 RepID=UPI0035CA5F0B